jgi:hypothetical protein
MLMFILQQRVRWAFVIAPTISANWKTDSVTYGVGALTDSPIYAELAEEEGVILVSDIFSEVLSGGALRADEIHPNAQGCRELAQGP